MTHLERREKQFREGDTAKKEREGENVQKLGRRENQHREG